VLLGGLCDNVVFVQVHGYIRLRSWTSEGLCSCDHGDFKSCSVFYRSPCRVRFQHGPLRSRRRCLEGATFTTITEHDCARIDNTSSSFIQNILVGCDNVRWYIAWGQIAVDVACIQEYHLGEGWFANSGCYAYECSVLLLSSVSLARVGY
jgi:hypothetical protein